MLESRSIHVQLAVVGLNDNRAGRSPESRLLDPAGPRQFLLTRARAGRRNARVLRSHHHRDGLSEPHLVRRFAGPPPALPHNVAPDPLVIDPCTALNLSVKQVWRPEKRGHYAVGRKAIDLLRAPICWIRPRSITTTLQTLRIPTDLFKNNVEEDRRRASLSLTAKGNKIYKDIEKFSTRVERELIAALDQTELTVLRDVLDKLDRQLESRIRSHAWEEFLKGRAE